eukprot:g8348.t1
MITSQETGTNAAEAGALVSPANAVRWRIARQALSDRASRGLSLMSGFKSRQEKNDGSSKLGGHDRSPVGPKGAQGPTPATAAAGAPDAPDTAATSEVTAGGAVSAGRSGSEEDFGPGTGGCGHLTKLVLKFTTASESDVQPSCEITTAGATIGQSSENTVSIPSDSMLAPLNHAIVKYECARQAPAPSPTPVTNNPNTDGASGGPAATAAGGGQGELVAAETPAAAEGVTADHESSRSNCISSTPTPGARTDGGGGKGGSAECQTTGEGPRGGRSSTEEEEEREDGLGGFFFSDGGQETDFSAAFRIRVGEGNRDWPLTQDCHFSAGLTVFRVHRTMPSPLSPQERERDKQSEPSAVVDTAESERRPEAGAGAGTGEDGTEGACRASEAGGGGRSGEETKTKTKGDTSSDHAGDGDGDSDAGGREDAADGAVGAFMQSMVVTPTATAAVAAAAASAAASNTSGAVKALTEARRRRRKTTQKNGTKKTIPGGLWLEAVAGCLKGHTWSVETGGATLGRASDNKLSLTDKEMSRRHSKIEYDETLKEFYLCDLGSLNGTYMQLVSVVARLGQRALDVVVKEAISEAFAAADKEFIATSRLPEAGSTATTCLVLGSRLYIANVGDSRTVLCRGGKLRMASADHKPCRPDEQERIQRAGGFVAHRRVMGELAVSRAFGDSEFKGGGPAAGNSGRGGSSSASREGAPQNGNNDDDEDAAMEERETAYAQLITAEPEFLVSEITPQDEFLVLACDGVFDVLTSEEVVADVYEKMKIHGDAQRCCEDLTEKAIVERRTRDNVSLVLVVFKKWF